VAQHSAAPIDAAVCVRQRSAPIGSTRIRRFARRQPRHTACSSAGCREKKQVEAKEAVMTKRLFSLVVGAAILAAFTPLSVTTSAAEVTCRVPFTFVVNGATLPPGSYSIASQGGAVLVQGLQKSALSLTTLMDRRTDQIGRAKVVFLKAGERYTLIEVWTTDGLARAIPGARKYVEERARLANVAVERIVILAN
jgi:hypothetical protein